MGGGDVLPADAIGDARTAISSFAWYRSVAKGGDAQSDEDWMTPAPRPHRPGADTHGSG
jgi:hypothetical protein